MHETGTIRQRQYDQRCKNEKKHLKSLLESAAAAMTFKQDLIQRLNNFVATTDRKESPAAWWDIVGSGDVLLVVAATAS